MRPRRGSSRIAASVAAALLVTACPALAGAPAASDGAPQEALLSAAVNGVADPEPVTVLRGPGDTVYASADLLHRWRLEATGLPSVLHEGVRYFLVNALSGAVVAIDEQKLEVRLTVPAARLAPTRIAYAAVPITDEVVSGCGNATMVLLIGAVESVCSARAAEWASAGAAEPDFPVHDETFRRRGLDDHALILTFIERGDAEAAAREARRHLQWVPSY